MMSEMIPHDTSQNIQRYSSGNCALPNEGRYSPLKKKGGLSVDSLGWRSWVYKCESCSRNS